MQRMALAIAPVLALAASASRAEADPLQIGGWFGPRVYSQDSLLGYIDDAPFHPMLENTIALGGRIAKPFFYPWLIPEFELALAPTRTTPTGTNSVSVFWLDPRVHIRFALPERWHLQPFVLVGGGSPIAISSARKTFETAIVGDGYLGAGFRFDTQKDFILRFDMRVAFLPGADSVIAPEIDVGFGIEFSVGKPSSTGKGKETPVVVDKGLDTDGDGIPDAVDKCPDRAEDFDGFEDQDGCPDIDNDMDRVLDIADKCPNVPETYNGFDDDDGCPDTVPPEVEALKGTIEGLLYAEGETVVRDSAQRSIAKIAKTMTSYPSIRVVLIGHTDNVEAQQFATPQPGQPPPDLASLSADLSRARAEAVKQALGAKGISAARIDVEGHSSEEPVADNAKPRGRLANRRVEIKLFVPPSAGK
jgi:outer membrane protein OmpA-like peptidoglycan-associated protein